MYVAGTCPEGIEEVWMYVAGTCPERIGEVWMYVAGACSEGIDIWDLDWRQRTCCIHMEPMKKQIAWMKKRRGDSCCYVSCFLL